MSIWNIIPEVELPSMEALYAQDQARLAEHANYLHSNRGAFIGVSLSAWLEQAKHSGIDFVPAKKVLDVSRWQFLNFKSGEPQSDLLLEALDGLRFKVPGSNMVRWDACASLSLKSAMTDLDPSPTSAMRGSFEMHPEGDPRAYDIIYQYPAAVVPVLARPWLQAQFHEGYPVEFRVFVEDSKVIGVANYYSQRALPDTLEINTAVEYCTVSAEKIIASMLERGAFPWMPNYEKAGFDLSQRAVHATLDFMVLENGEVTFLEAGPPFGAGAHPCAFEGSDVNGVALGAAWVD